MTGTMMPERARKVSKSAQSSPQKKNPETTQVRLLNKSAAGLYSLAELMGVTAAEAFDKKFGALLDDELIALTEARLDRLRKAAKESRPG